MNPYTLTLLRHGSDDSSQMQHSWTRIASLAPVTAMATSPSPCCREFAVGKALAGSVTLQVDPQFGEWNTREEESAELFRTRVLAGLSIWMTRARGSHRLLVTHGDVITVLLAELLGIEAEVAGLMTVRPGGFVQLSILDGHPAYLMRLDGPDA